MEENPERALAQLPSAKTLFDMIDPALGKSFDKHVMPYIVKTAPGAEPRDRAWRARARFGISMFTRQLAFLAFVHRHSFPQEIIDQVRAIAQVLHAWLDSLEDMLEDSVERLHLAAVGGGASSALEVPQRYAHYVKHDAWVKATEDAEVLHDARLVLTALVTGGKERAELAKHLRGVDGFGPLHAALAGGPK